MKTRKKISVFEHQRLRIGDQNFTQSQLDSLLKLNDYHNGTYFEPIAKGIKFNQYVGVIQVDGVTIEINPKADIEDDNDRWKGVLLQMLRACGRIKAQSTGPAHVKRKHLNLLEVYFELYLYEIHDLIRRGLIKKYGKHTSNVRALKGKLEFAGNIQRNIIHKERFYTTHQVYDQYHLLHKVLFKALTIVDQFTKGMRLADSCKRALFSFPEFDEVKITRKKLNSIVLDRKSKGYSYALELARLIILNYSPDIVSGKERMISLLFDMNQLWEEYILKQLKEACLGTDWRVSGQESRDFWGSNTLRPDIVLRKNNTTYIIDTKWKRPQSSSASVGDLRQIYTYCRFWDAEKGILLYPGELQNEPFKKYETDDYIIRQGDTLKIEHDCRMSFVSVIEKETGLIDKLIGKKVLDLFN